MNVEKKTYEARKTITVEEQQPNLFGEILDYFNKNGAVHGLWESYKSIKSPLQKVSDADLAVLDKFAPSEARKWRIYNSLIDETIKEGQIPEDEVWSAYHIKLDDMAYKNLKIVLTSKPENEEQPETSNLIVTMIVEGEDSSAKLEDVIKKFGFMQI